MAAKPLVSALLSAAMALGVAACAGIGGAPGAFQYVAIGASDAVGVGADRPGAGYVQRIRAALEARGQRVTLLDLGIPGADTETLRDEVRSALRTRMQPGLITLWTGANDLIQGETPEDFADAFTAILRDLSEQTRATIVVATLPDLTQLPLFRANPNLAVTKARIDAYNDVIRGEAYEYYAPVVELADEPVAANLVSDADGFHPSSAGYAAIADRFLRVILPELGLPP